MLAEKRRETILKLIKEQGAVRVPELSRRFQVSPSTVRRDLEHLDTQGQLRRTYGGAVAREVEARAGKKAPVADAEERIGRAAADLVVPGETVFIGPGPLCQAVARQLCGRSDVTVLTNALEVAWTLYRDSALPLVVTGGPLVRPGGALVGDLARRALETLRADRLVVEASGVSPVEGLTADQLPQAELIRPLLESVSQVVVLTPVAGLGRAGAAWLGPVSEADVIITGRDASAAIAWDLTETGVKVTLV